MDILAEVLEIVMLVCFGCSWPISVYKSIKIKTSVGKSATFNILLIIGYIGGIVSKFLKMGPFMEANAGEGLKKGIFIFALIMYFVNLAMITTNLVLYYTNKRLDNLRADGTLNADSNADVVENIAEQVKDSNVESDMESENK